MPVIEIFDVDHITYNLHQKADKPDMLRVTYYCGLVNFSQYVCIEHDGYAGKKARDWWRKRAPGSPLPTSARQALTWAHTLPPATHIRVHTNTKFPDVKAACFDGTAFGTSEPSHKQVTVRSSLPQFDPNDDGYGHGGPSHGLTQEAIPLPDMSGFNDDDVPF